MRGEEVDIGLNSFFPCKKKLKRDTNVTCGTVTYVHGIGFVRGSWSIAPLKNCFWEFEEFTVPTYLILWYNDIIFYNLFNNKS